MAVPAPPVVHLIVIPFPAQGHLIPLLDLAHSLSLSGRFSLTILSTPSNLPLLHPFLLSTPSANPLLLPLPDPSLPDHVRHLPPTAPIAALIHSLSSLSPQILSWARSHPSPPLAILSDFFLGWTQLLADELSIPRLAFFSSGALLDSLLHLLFIHPPPSTSPSQVVSFPGLPSFPYSHLPSIFRRCAAAAASVEWEFARESFLANAAAWGAVINTFDDLESPYISRLKELYKNPRVWAVGPLVPAVPPENRGGASSVAAAEWRAWLGARPARSVVYVCFGSQFDPSPAKAGALATALERSGASFLWCVGRDRVDGGDGPVVPPGFEERVKGRGLVIRGWAPQVAILSNPAVGSFVTHCGWNSVLEGIVAGVTLLAWPMEADQFVNARLLVEEAKVAVMVCAGGPDVVPDPEELGVLMGESVREGAWPEVRARVAEMKEKARVAVSEGGSSWRDMEGLASQLGGLGVEGTIA